MSSAHEPAVGIDLGTTFSVIAHFDKDGRCRTIQNAEGDLTTPSVVFFDREGPIVGKEAVKVAEHEPERIAQLAKRDMGKSSIRDKVLGQNLPPEVVQAVILRKLADDTALMLGDLNKVVVTVPAYFNEPRRKATQDAGRIAGLDVIDIINEPTAAAIAYGVQAGFLDDQGAARDKEVILVYDLGGGTFDVTLMEIDGANYRALGTAGDVYLGGVDWDHRVATFLADQFKTEHGIDLRENPIGQQILLREAEDAKRTLTSRASAMVHISFGGSRSRIELSREQFDELTADLVARTVFTTQRLLRDCHYNWSGVTRILLAGGSSRMPTIQEALEKESGMSVDRSLSPDEAIAHGAAVHAAIRLKGAGSPNITIKNVNSHDLGVMGLEKATGMPRRQVLIPRNTALPAAGGGVFRTREDDQINVAIDVVEGGDASGKNATKIGRFVVGGLPDQLPAGTPIKVRFRYLDDGRLTVRAQLKDVADETSMEVDRSTGLSEQEVEDWRTKREANHLLNEAPARPVAPVPQAPSPQARSPQARSPQAPSPQAPPQAADTVAATPAGDDDIYDQLLDPDELDELGEDLEAAEFIDSMADSSADMLPSESQPAESPPEALPAAPVATAVATPIGEAAAPTAEPVADEAAPVAEAAADAEGDQEAPREQPQDDSPAFDWIAEEASDTAKADDDDDLQSFLQNLS
ncbi:MAG: Hsp70 family protein [Pirellulaceae bacterium]|jgi:molecular chaperone DnaK|nr:Hsp70 family protein [Pirellulaceae bacterium]MDP7014301.1 Hsp70 family protein [Pirellulaceae bacterium]